MVLNSAIKQTIYRCRQLVTMRGPARGRVREEMSEIEVIDNGAFCVQEGMIAAVGAWEDIRPHAESSWTQQDNGGVITPGLIDAHTHAVFVGNRSNEFEMRSSGATYEDIASNGGGIRSSMRAVREATKDELLLETLKHLRWMMSTGTTTIECKSGYGLSAPEETKMLQAMNIANRTDDNVPEIVPTFLGAHAVPPEFEGDRAGYIENIIDVQLPKCKKLCEAVDIFVENGYFDAAHAERLANAAKAHGLKFKMHVDQLSNGGGASLAARLGAITADHLEQTDTEGIAALAEAGVIPVLLPASVYCLGKEKYPDARSMIDIGLPVVLATDFNPGSSPTPSLPFVMSLACTQMKMTPAEALTACTVNAAYALDRSDRGTIEPGKRADFVEWDITDWREIPYWLGAPIVRCVYIASKPRHNGNEYWL